MRNVMFEVPSAEDIERIVITLESIEKQTDPEIIGPDSSAEIKEA